MKLKVLIIVAIIVLAVAIVVLNLKPKPQDAAKAATAKGSVPPTPGFATANADGQKQGVTGNYLSTTLVLRKGVQAPAEVKELQTILNQSDPTAQLVVDGIFGDLTEKTLLQLYGSDGITLEQAWRYFVKGYSDTADKWNIFSQLTGINI